MPLHQSSVWSDWLSGSARLGSRRKLSRHFEADYRTILAFLIDYGYQMEEIDHRNREGDAVLLEKDAALIGNTMMLCKKAT